MLKSLSSKQPDDRAEADLEHGRRGLKEILTRIVRRSGDGYTDHHGKQDCRANRDDEKDELERRIEDVTALRIGLPRHDAPRLVPRAVGRQRRLWVLTYNGYAVSVALEECSPGRTLERVSKDDSNERHGESNACADH